MGRADIVVYIREIRNAYRILMGLNGRYQLGDLGGRPVLQWILKK
jgi:hypothetical protein